MATKSGFSKGWKVFVDHKWSKKSFRPCFNALPIRVPFPRVPFRERLFPKLRRQHRPLGATACDFVHSLQIRGLIMTFATQRLRNKIFSHTQTPPWALHQSAPFAEEDKRATYE